MTSTSDVPARPNQLTVNFLQNILQDSYPSHRVINFKWEPMNLGVIADVVIITVEIESKGENDKAKRMKIRLVGKFMRLEIPFESMFVVESNFYKAFAAKTGDLGVKISAALDDFPFAIPAATFASSKLIILDYVEPVRTYTCVEGSPQHMISMLVTKLAQMHARYWNHSCNGLATPAGIGSQLTGEEKRLQFPSCWKVYLNDVSLESSDMARIIVLCQRLSQNPNLLERVHEMVESGPSCFIHGDFHIANMLLPTDDTEDERTWLLDWATCGRGNPMRDLAFFFIVSVKAIHRRAQEAQCQQKYFDTLTAEIEAVHFTMDELRWQYKVEASRRVGFTLSRSQSPHVLEFAGQH
ncbi:aminoglycoside phosphotransferase [Plasmopara halstedii]|uniref:Aminoglycoside phosphotransferase n=1 Tax=Plasmopara halstedii TaxID=4781 RepID=A0A0P1B1S4_PLAHL|nr:aminoglycoside phosphotransferase [Plasmopara halstedii]CEG48653.1 aminoglycoside phosphotransferase [Plasmopara halstedii]|eukprot:XP_024585022.1 aminoglycoside phosphotransferase [Plasmopara halstedii]